MTRVHFSKGHGTGNDFILVDDPNGALQLTPEVVAGWCDRHTGIGADGLIRVVRSSRLPDGAAALAEDSEAEWFMDYRNADGSVAEMCGNGVRVFAEYLHVNGLVPLDAGGTVHIGTRAGVKLVTKTSSGYVVDMGGWKPAPTRTVRTPGTKARKTGTGIDVGNPHQVVRLETEYELRYLDLREMPVLFPKPEEGSNVEFYLPLDDEHGAGHVRMRVYERGVGETQSCGTGVVATALAARASRQEHEGQRLNQWRVEVPGGTLGVRILEDGDSERVLLSGPAQIVFRGEIVAPGL
ncbi:MAG: diaminopimelate epimerase [Microbacteriaceae bacterium]|jgi:diaminopimelate epimerase|nr:diaminopimelate epimerase [Microbacteriaceae bacterium]